MKKAIKAEALIILSLHNSQLKYIRSIEEAELIWNILKDVYELKGRQHRLFLQW